MGMLKAGTVQKDITPPVGIELSGYIRRFGSSTGIHDPLSANFLLLDNGTNQVLITSLDILNISTDFALKAKEAISSELKMPKKNILIACIHTHSAPGLHFFRNIGASYRDWKEKVLQILIKGASETRQKLKNVSAGTAIGVATIGKNRRKKGGPIDPYFPLFCIRLEDKLPLALIANYGCHPVVLEEDNLLISSDYIGFFRNHLNRSFSSDIFTVFLTGATGDVDPISRGGFKTADRLGKILAKEALKTMENMEFQKYIEIEANETSLEIPYSQIPLPDETEKIYRESLSQYEEAVKKGEKEEIKIRKAFLLWAEEIREKAIENKLPSALKCKIQSIRLGDAVLLASPFELFSSVSSSLRKKSRIENLFMVGYANGYCGYLPDESSYLEGGYEVEEAYKFCGLLPLSSQAERLFVEKALSLIKDE
jgi:neutral ceramidase